MLKSLPERPLLIYPSLIHTLGLEEALMLSQLAERASFLDARESNGYLWYELSSDKLDQLFSFWDRRDLQRIATNLREKGVLLINSPALEQAESFRFAFNEKTQARRAAFTPQKPLAKLATTDPGVASFLSRNYIAPNWQPDETTLAQLAQHGIPDSFARQQVPEFVTYWRERGEKHHSWGSKFIQHALRQWREFQAEQHQRDQESMMSGDWSPSRDAIEILTEQAGISAEFVEDAIPEFVLYWRERGEKHRTWNSKFVQHVRMQWLKFTAALEHNSVPAPINANWQPSNDVYDVLRLANIDVEFARSLIPEFVLYWRDRGDAHTSWNTKYLQQVKRQWAQRHLLDNQRSTRDISLAEQLTDRSWAN